MTLQKDFEGGKMWVIGVTVAAITAVMASYDMEQTFIDTGDVNLLYQLANTTDAYSYAKDIADIQSQIQLQNQFVIQDQQEDTALRDADLPKLSKSRIAELKLHVSLSASAYCMTWNIYPAFKCGYPRCSNPELTLDAMGGTGQEDVLLQTQTHSQFRGPQSEMTGYVAINPELDHYESTDLTVPDGYTKKTILVVFRGSLAIKNFFYDLNFALVDFQYPGAPKNARIHTGFWKVWMDVKQQILDAMSDIISKESGKVWFDVALQGHSLGGAISILSALALREIAINGEFPSMGRFVDSDGGYAYYEEKAISFRVFSYGEPRVGNVYFAEWLMDMKNFPVQRTTFHNDIIPHLPPRKLLPVFKDVHTFHHHAAESFIVKQSGDVVECDKEQEFSPGMYSRSKTRGESQVCSAGMKRLNILSHLTYLDVVIGPWC